MSKQKIMAAIAAAILAGVSAYFGLAGDGAEPAECCACPDDAAPAEGSSSGGSGSSSGGSGSSDGGSSGE